VRILVDRGKCTGLGICESLAPEHFEVDEDGALVVLDEHVTERTWAGVEEAFSGCPAEALRMERP
jgi:ferredoxin